MKLLRSLRRGNLLFLNIIIYLFYYSKKSQGKVKDKEHLKLRCLVQVDPGPGWRHFLPSFRLTTIISGVRFGEAFGPTEK